MASKHLSGRSKRRRRRTTRFESLEHRYVMDSTLVFNEIMYHPADESAGGVEWVEFYNQLTSNLDVSDWTVEGGIDFKFPDGTVVPGRSYLVVASDPAALELATGLTGVHGPFTGTLNNAGESLTLYNQDRRRLNEVEYSDGGNWPVAADGSGASVAKADEWSASHRPENWTFSTQVGGTPGQQNFARPGTIITETTNYLTAGNPVTAFVPTDDSLGLNWTTAGFDDSSWLTGTTGVGYERSSGYDPFFGLDFDDPPNGQTAMPMRSVSQSAYMRVPFTVNDDLTTYDAISLGMMYDDGFVAYLNGTKIAESFAPANPTGTSGATGQNGDGNATSFQPFDITAFANEFVVGQNLLAIHGLNSGVNSSDALWSPEITGVDFRSPDPTGGPLTVKFNEVSGAGDAAFFIELANDGDDDVDLGGMVLQSNGTLAQQYVLPAVTLSPGSLYVVTEAAMGFRPANNDRIFLLNAAENSVSDGRKVTNSLRGRATQFPGEWLYPASATSGLANAFSFETDIVINEIMYHYIPQTKSSAQAYEENDEEWIELFNRSGADIDVSGWSLDGEVSFAIPAATTIAAGEYLVIARDELDLAAKYPSIDIAGSFSGSLSNSEGTVTLLDASKNPADTVTYYEAGQWPETADGGGSSLELRDAFADNSQPAVWAPSIESEDAVWDSYSFRGTSERILIDDVFNEFILGMLDSGEILLDDISVIHDPDGAATEMIQNGTFTGDTIGQAPATWRLIGNHSGIVVADPDDAANKVLHLNALGAHAHVHDHVETTFAGNVEIEDGDEYEISFRGRWITGNNQVNTRLYLSRLPSTHSLPIPDHLGTPGAVNSQVVANTGPTFTELAHFPVQPEANVPVTVTVAAQDPDGIAAVQLNWRPDGGAWTATTMTINADGLFEAEIPGQGSGQIVQFYVSGQDGSAITGVYPKDGVESRVLYQVNDGVTNGRPTDTLRIVMMQDQESQLFSAEERMSNNYVGATLVQNGQIAYYDVGVRLVGSRFIRPNSGYKVKLNSEQKFYGVHKSLRFDINGEQEVILKQLVNRAAGSNVSLYDDVAHLVSPNSGHNGPMLLNLARYEDIYLDEQFENGGDGTKFELDDITYPTNPNPSPEGIKTGTAVSPQDILDRGDDPEFYRGQLLLKNNRTKDDFDSIVALADAINKTGNELREAIDGIMDVDLWMRHYATQSWVGNWDTYGFQRPKNLRIYTRPSDGKFIPLFWDADLANLTAGIIYNGNETRLDEIRNLPENTRLFYGHMWDLMNRSFNPTYAADWITHYGTLGVGAGNANLTRITNREINARAHITNTVAQLPYEITTNGGSDFTVNDSAVTLEGTGWVNVRTMFVNGTDVTSQVTWTGVNTWEVRLPLAVGPNTFAFEAFDFEGNPVCDDNVACSVSTDSITVTSTLVDRPLQNHLRIDEINYNPYEPSAAEIAAGFDDADDFEFLEFVNTSATETLVLDNASFGDGVEFVFPVGTSLLPGQRLLLVEDQAAFEFRYGTGLNVVGQWSGGLSNNGEIIEVLDADLAVVQNFEYFDTGNWPGRADGKGSSLQVLDPLGDYTDDDNFYSSMEYDGSPGVAALAPFADVVVNEVLSHTDLPLVDSIELYNTTSSTIEIGGWYISDSTNNYRKFQIPLGTMLAGDDYIVFDEADFNPTPGVGNSFALNSYAGDDVYLLQADAGTDELTRFADHVEFGASINGESFGRYPNGVGEIYPLVSRTLDAVNDVPRVGPVIISEIMYNAPDPDGVGGIDANDLEFVEIYNPTQTDVDLSNWSLGGGVSYDFEFGQMLPANSVLVILPFDPVDAANATRLSDFRTYYDISPAVPVVGGISGQLANSGDVVTLYRADSPPLEDPTFIPKLIEDQADYDDASPWPTGPDGGGTTLTRLLPALYGNDPTSWKPDDPTPGVVAKPRIVSRRFVYNNSFYDGNNSTIDANDNNAVTDVKTALLPGQSSTADNFTNFELGLNAIALDILQHSDLNNLSVTDFEFRFGNDSNPAMWAFTPTPSMTVLANAGFVGSDRLFFSWPDNTLQNGWLQITAKSNAATAFVADDVAYFGSVIADTGTFNTNYFVNAWDFAGVRDNMTINADKENVYDIDRDSDVDARDLMLARDNITNFVTAVQPITAPAAAPPLALAFQRLRTDNVGSYTTSDQAITPTPAAESIWGNVEDDADPKQTRMDASITPDAGFDEIIHVLATDQTSGVAPTP